MYVHGLHRRNFYTAIVAVAIDPVESAGPAFRAHTLVFRHDGASHIRLHTFSVSRACPEWVDLAVPDIDVRIGSTCAVRGNAEC